MQLVEPKLGEVLARIVKEAIREGQIVELEGLGTFEPSDREGMRFIAETAPRVFIAYVAEDAPFAARLADDLADQGFKPWIDRRKLLPGQNWRRAIERAIERSDFFIPCFSAQSLRKRGQFPHEVRQAMRFADRMPLDDNFLVPVRLDGCVIPSQIGASTQYVDLFPNWDAGVEQLCEAMWDEFAARLQRGEKV